MLKNLKYVNVRQDRTCYLCKGKIPSGSKCLTINKKYKGRKWICCECIRYYKRVKSAESTYNLTPFDDEGAAYANMDYLKECLGDFYERTGINLSSRNVKTNI